MKKIFLFFILFFITRSLVAEISLDYLNHYSASLRESPVFTNKNSLNPDYTAYYKSLAPQWYAWDYWFGSQCNEPLCQQLGLLLSSAKKVVENLDRRIAIDKPKKFIIFGDLLGDLHSFVRDLNKLYEERLIDQNLILAPDTNMVFLGNFLTGAHSVELLSVILHMLVQNKGNIFLFSGPYETGGYWRDFSTLQQLNVLMGRATKNGNQSYADMIDDFLGQLQRTLWITYKDAHQQDAEFLLSYGGLNSFDIELTGKVKTQICSENPGFVYRENEGLSFDIPQKGVSTWRLFSCPDGRIQKLYHFYDDSFVVLDAAPDVYDWVLTLYSRDVRKEAASFKLLFRNARTGQIITEEGKNVLLQKRSTFLEPVKETKIDRQDEIVIGSILDLSSMNAFKGDRLLRGMCLAINKENIEHGGINGRFIRLVALDDKYSDHLARQSVEDLYRKFKTNVLLTPSGTGPLQASLATIKKYGFLALFPYSGSSDLRQSDAVNYINFRASYDAEITALVNQACFNLGIKRFAILYENNAFGQMLLKSVQKGLDAFKVEDILKLPYQATTLINTSATQKLSEFNPGGVFFFINQYQAESLIRSMNLDILNGVKLFGTSMLPADFSIFLNKRGLTLMKTEVVPNPVLSSLAIVKDYKKDLSDYMPEELMSTQSLEGYINAKIFLEALKNAPLTRKDLGEWFEKLDKKEFEGLTLSFNPQNRQIASYLWLNKGFGVWDSLSS